MKLKQLIFSLFLLLILAPNAMATYTVGQCERAFNQDVRYEKVGLSPPHIPQECLDGTALGSITLAPANASRYYEIDRYADDKADWAEMLVVVFKRFTEYSDNVLSVKIQMEDLIDEAIQEFSALRLQELDSDYTYRFHIQKSLSAANTRMAFAKEQLNDYIDTLELPPPTFKSAIIPAPNCIYRFFLRFGFFSG